MGECLLDLTWVPAGVPAQRATGLMAGTGGSPANVATALARLGVPATLVATVGADGPGAFVTAQLAARGVDTRGVRALAGVRTGAVFIHVDGRGRRTFTPARENTADGLMGPEHLARGRVARARAVLVSTGLMRTAAGARLVRHLRSQAAEAAVPVFVDANLRPKVWRSLQANVTGVWRAARGVTVLKANRQEALALCGTRSVGQALRHMRAHARLAAVITLGSQGAVGLADGAPIRVAAPTTRVVDTTGAGDAFMAGLMAVFCQRGPHAQHLPAALEAGCQLGAQACATVGAVAGLHPADGLGRWL